MSSLVGPLGEEIRESPDRTSLTVGGEVSTVKESDAEPVLPAVSVSLAVIVWAPSARLGVKLQ
jgi:hypothetical protein